MTSVAFIMGVVPLVLASGAGAEVRQAMGIAVFAGMLGVTLFGLVPDAGLLRRRAGSGGAVVRARTSAVAPQVPARCGGSLIVRIQHRFASTRDSCRVLVRIAGVRGAQCARTPPSAAGDTSPLTSLGRGGLLRIRRTTRAGGGSSTIRCSSELENAALDANRDVRSALARLDQSRAVFDEDAPPAAIRRSTAGAYVDVREQAQPGFRDEPARINTYRAGFDASWELDLFGRVRAADRRGVGQRRELRGRARRRARQRRRRTSR